MCFVYVCALEECARVVAYCRSLLIGPHYRSDKCWHDTDGIRARHFCAKMPSRLMSIVMIVVVEHERACVRARVVRWRAIHVLTKEMRFQGSVTVGRVIVMRLRHVIT